MDGKVLVISDQETTATITQALSGSFQIITCENKKEALGLLEKEEVKPFALIVSGCKTAKEIRGQISEMKLNCNCDITTIINGLHDLEGILEESPDDEIIPKDLIELSLLSVIQAQSARRV